jgi:hypothetical protein
MLALTISSFLSIISFVIFENKPEGNKIAIHRIVAFHGVTEEHVSRKNSDGSQWRGTYRSCHVSVENGLRVSYDFYAADKDGRNICALKIGNIFEAREARSLEDRRHLIDPAFYSLTAIIAFMLLYCFGQKLMRSER